MNVAVSAPQVDPQAAAVATAPGCLVIVARHHGMHLAAPQIIRDNFLGAAELTVPELLKCVKKAGLKAKVVHLKWSSLSHLKKVLPAIVRLKNGSYLVLHRLEGDAENARIILHDPHADEDTPLVIDRVRFEEAFTGDVILIKRNYDIAQEERPFSLGLVVALVFRERRIARDVAICAIILGILALAPVIFWRLM